MGAPGRLLRAPAARRRGGAAVPRSRRAARARRRALGRVQRAVPGAVHGAAGHDAVRLPADRRAVAAGAEAAGRDGADAPRLGGGAREPAVRAWRLARVALRRRDARRHATRRRRLRDRRLLSQRPRPRRRLAQPARRRRAADRRARRVPALARRRGPHRRTGRAGPERGRTRDRRRDRRRALPGFDRRRGRDAGGAAEAGRPALLVLDRAEELRPRGRDREGRLGARRPDPVGEPGRPRRRNRARRPAPRRSSCTR